MAKKSFPVVIIFFIVLIGLFALGIYQQTSAQKISKEINNLNEKIGNSIIFLNNGKGYCVESPSGDCPGAPDLPPGGVSLDKPTPKYY